VAQTAFDKLKADLAAAQATINRLQSNQPLGTLAGAREAYAHLVMKTYGEDETSLRDETKAYKEAFRAVLDAGPVIPGALFTPHNDTKSRGFCGPTAIAAVTGEPISVVRDAVRHASGRIKTADGKAHPVMGLYNKDLLAAMELLGWHVTEEWSKPAGESRYTLAAFAQEYGNDGPFIVNVTDHYTAISHGLLCDPFTKVPVDLFGGILDTGWFGGRKHKGATGVKKWWRFEKKGVAGG
jgi:hypothetical protein